MVRQNDKMKVLAYQIKYETSWEPGVPDESDPSYEELLNTSYRSRMREDGFLYDLDADDLLFPDFNKLVSKLWRNPPEDQDILVDVPNPIIFGAWDFSFAEYLDYPCTVLGCPIMSPQMLETIISAGAFRHCTYPTLIEDMTAELGSNNRTGLRKNDFLIVQTLEFLDDYDWEKSEYTIDGDATNFTKVILKEPIPSLFRLVGNETRLFVSAAAKEALEASGTARGAWFLPIDEEYKLEVWAYKTKFQPISS